MLQDLIDATGNTPDLDILNAFDGALAPAADQAHPMMNDVWGKWHRMSRCRIMLTQTPSRCRNHHFTLIAPLTLIFTTPPYPSASPSRELSVASMPPSPL